MKKLALSTTFCVILLTSFSQQNTDSMTNPVAIDKEILSGLGLPPYKLKANPEREYYQKRLYKGSELSVYILSSETATNVIDRFPIEEFVFYINGKADIELENNRKLSFLSGDYLFVPKGFSGSWTNNGGNQCHLELSVISNKRTDSTLNSKAGAPFLLNRELISGIGITELKEGQYLDELYSGIELDVTTESEKPQTKEINDLEKEQFIRVLNGSVTVTSLNSKPQTFYTGDFFILPKGFSGTWASSASHLFRTLRVSQANQD